MLTLRKINEILKRLLYGTEEKTCPECEGRGKVWIYRKPDKSPDILDTMNVCPICNGTGRVRRSVKKEKT